MTAGAAATGWRAALPAGLRAYVEPAPLAAFFLGVSSGAPYAMIAATLTTRLAQDGIRKSTVTAFTLTFLVYNLKFLWAWVVDGVKVPVLSRLGQRVSWLVLAGVLVMAAIINLALVDPRTDLLGTVYAAILVAVAGATYDIVIDAYRIETLEPEQLGVGAGMSQYGWRIGSVVAAALALVIAGRWGWSLGYAVCAALALPAMLVGLVLGEPPRRREPQVRTGFDAVLRSIIDPLVEFMGRRGALLVLLFVLLHKVGDTIANLTFRLLFNELQYSNDEIAFYDVGFGFWAYLAGVFVGGWLYSRVGLKRSVLWSLVLMAVSNLSFAVLASLGHSNWGLAGAIAFENLTSGIGGVTVVAYLSALCDLRYTAAQFALLSAASSVVGRFISGTTAGKLIELLGFVDFYLLSTVVAVPGVLLFWLLMRKGLIDVPDKGVT
ncbi:MAG: MFS transporter [Proteobacteria bacterium]|nr:MFS transporter [Pseudomonadota bacterium]